MHEFFPVNFPLHEYFFVLRPPPPISFLMVRPLTSPLRGSEFTTPLFLHFGEYLLSMVFCYNI